MSANLRPVFARLVAATTARSVNYHEEEPSWHLCDDKSGFVNRSHVELH